MKRFLYAFAFLILISCKKNSSADIIQEPETNQVFVVGNSSDFAEPIPEYWKNGELFKLPGGITYNGRNAQLATGIAVSQGDVYVCGKYSYGAAYWKNGIPVSLDSPTTYASAVAVSGSDVYVVGTGGGAVYWKNGQRITLSDSSNSGAGGIAISGNDVYIVGNIGNYAVYWKNGQLVNLSDGVNAASASTIAISGNDVYITVVEFLPAGGFFWEYWKNGQLTKITVSSNPSLLVSEARIAVSNNNVYIVASIFDPSSSTPSFGYIMYWKNGNPVTITDAKGSASASGIAVLGDDVYISGTEFRDSRDFAVYWKNGKRIELNDNAHDVFTTGIVVLPQ